MKRSPAIIVIGGGPAGLMAAGRAAERGVAVTLIEKMERPGKKLGITGKGRCNITNNRPLDEFLRHFGTGGRFLKPSFYEFFVPDLLAFLASLGVETVTERGSRVFPADNQAVEVVKALAHWTRKTGAAIKTRTRALELLRDGNVITGVRVESNRTGQEKIFRADAVILATGGASYPLTGSTGDGYRLAVSAGHAIVPVRPALVPLETKVDRVKGLQDLTLKNVAVSLRIHGRKPIREFGEMAFTSFGVSGPVILTLSGRAVDALDDGLDVELSIDLKPALDDKKLDARLLRDLRNNPKMETRDLLRGLLPPPLIPLCLDMTGVPDDRTGNQVTAGDRRALRLWLKDFRLPVTGHRPIEEAIITAGGVSLREVNPKTMESRLVKGLFFSGEVLDINADTGGYNLQAAFSTGHLAGVAAAETGKN